LRWVVERLSVSGRRVSLAGRHHPDAISDEIVRHAATTARANILRTVSMAAELRGGAVTMSCITRRASTLREGQRIFSFIPQKVFEGKKEGGTSRG
jgi:hypothetical protein